MPLTRRDFARLGLGSIAGLLSARYGWSEPSDNAPVRLLRDFAAEKGLYFGAATGPKMLASDEAYARLVDEQCSMLVPEGCMKWDALRPAPNRFDFALADNLVDFAETHGKKLRGHNLVWHRELPKWFGKVNSANAKNFLVDHITRVAGRYAGKIHSWDVVNEAIDPDSPRADHLRESPWLKFLGPDYIEIAHRTAAAADPNALITYNDFGMEDDEARSAAKRASVLALLRKLKQKGVPLHALGLQSHLTARKDWAVTPGFAPFLRAVADLGLQIFVTELDVDDRQLPGDVRIRERSVALIYQNYLNAVLREPAVKAVMCWGITDRYTWLNSPPYSRDDGMPQRALPFNSIMKPTIVFEAMVASFQKAPLRK